MTNLNPSGGLNPRLAEVMEGVRAAVRANDMERASGLARQALDANLEHPALLNLRALWYESQGRYQDALSDLERAEALAPDDFTVQNAKGILFGRLQRPRDAAVAFDAAVSLAPRFAEAFFNQGSARETLGDRQGARLSYEQALALKPDFPDPLARLGALALSLGETNQARVHAEQALAIDAQHALATVTLAQAERAHGELGAAEARLRGLLGRQGISPGDRSLVHGALGDLLESQGRFDDAFEVRASGNAELRSFFEPGLASGLSQKAPQMLLWMVDYFSKANPEVWRPRKMASAEASGGAAGHVFLIGFPNSGAGELGAELARHDTFEVLEERDTLAEAVRDFMVDKDDLDYLAKVSDESLDAYRRAYWRRVRESGADPAGKVFVDVQALNAVKLPLIVKLFPGAKAVLAVRDPRDNVLSAFASRFPINASTFELLTIESCAVLYDLVSRLSLICVERLGISTGVMHLEDFAKEPTVPLKAVCDFLGVDPGEEAERLWSGAGAGEEGLGIGRWRAYEKHLASVRDILDPWVERFGYVEPPAPVGEG